MKRRELLVGTVATIGLGFIPFTKSMAGKPYTRCEQWLVFDSVDKLFPVMQNHTQSIVRFSGKEAVSSIWGTWDNNTKIMLVHAKKLITEDLKAHAERWMVDSVLTETDAALPRNLDRLFEQNLVYAPYREWADPVIWAMCCIGPKVPVAEAWVWSALTALASLESKLS